MSYTDALKAIGPLLGYSILIAAALVGCALLVIAFRALARGVRRAHP